MSKKMFASFLFSCVALFAFAVTAVAQDGAPVQAQGEVVAVAEVDVVVAEDCDACTPAGVVIEEDCCAAPVVTCCVPVTYHRGCFFRPFRFGGHRGFHHGFFHHRAAYYNPCCY